MRQRVLLVCTANVCRSPVALALWTQQAGSRGKRVVASSAGTEAHPGQPADAMCVALLAARGLDLSAHRSVRVNLERVADHDLILVMEKRHAQWLCGAAPVLNGRVHLLGRWGVGEIADPHGKEQENYERSIVDIDTSIGQWLDRLR
jgi:protein-tyrosine phosphatase